MTPILTGIIASGISGHLTPPWSPEGAYDSLATITVGSTAVSSITFSGIPTGYKHLQIRTFSRNNANSGGGAEENMRMRFNGDSGENYSSHAIIGNGSSASAWAFDASNDNDILLSYGTIPMSNATANVFGAQIIDILDYTNSNKFKTIKSIGGVDKNGSGYSNFSSGNWRSLNSINSILLFPQAGAFVQNSQFALYGVK
jgi:hypothetical protein